MKLKLSTGTPGCGKTTRLHKEIIANPGRYILSCPRINLIEEQERNLNSMIRVSQTKPIILSVHGKGSQKAPVLRRIAEAIAKYRYEDHVILLITHEGMMNADMSDLSGWHVKIDEVPNAVVTDKICAEASAVYLQKSYGLDPIADTNWSRLLVHDDTPITRKVMRDDVLNDLVTLDKRARSAHGVYVDVQNWADLQERGRRLQWWSVWTPLQLESAESVTIVGASYHHSVLAKVTDAFYPGAIEIEEVRLVGQPRKARRVFVHYFTRGHRGSSTFWQTKGRGHVVRVCRHLEKVLLGYWSGNKVITDYCFGRLSGQQVPPKTEGTNDLMHHTTCAFIYSAKMLASDQPLIDLFGLSPEDIERAREIEDIIQFIYRGDLRNAASSEDYHIYLYDLYQAEALEQYLMDQQIDEIVLVPVEEAGLLDVRRLGRGRPSSEAEDSRSREERLAEQRQKDRERQKRKRDRKKEQKLRAGVYRGPGRPKKKGYTQDQPRTP
ncbi:hypothetical protein MHY87_03530 [Microvirga sp. ACRRW]|uniref:hypothetical protein n=1 Tax=Microvirga sp. ACRRW TaxID=2918205 RepID=UPI001EF4D793|nr:hypothetical protein [Microvirga sp. ACRRW]MCG7391972.1 hypothetical protein [Microvirga sp. ACRRW]